MSTYEDVSQYFDTIGRRVMVGSTYCLAAMLLFVTLIGEGSNRGHVFLAYTVASVLMFVGGPIEFIWGVDAERRPLEAVATPLSARGLRAGTESGLTGDLTSHVRRPPAPEGSAVHSWSGSAGRYPPGNAGLPGGQVSGAEPHITRNADCTDGSTDKFTGRRARTKRARSGDWRGRR